MHPERIRILKFLTFFGIGGTERQILNLAQRMDRSRFDVHFGCLRREGPLLAEVESWDVPVSEFRTSSFLHYRTPLAQLRLARYLRQNRIQIVHTYGFYSNVFAVPAARLARVPLVVASIRDTGELLTSMQKRVQKQVCRLADYVLANADAVRDWLTAEGYDGRKIRVIRNGIVHTRFQNSGHAGLRREFGLPENADVVTVLSRLNPLKGVEYFLDAAAALKDSFPNARFLVVGDGGHKAALEAHAARLGLGDRVIFTGFRMDVPQVLADSTISVLPSLSEGLSNTLLESMAAGVPVVATRVGGNQEAVHDAGLIVEPSNARELEHAIGKLLADPGLRERLGNTGRRRIASHFSVEKMIRDTESFYLQSLSRRAGPEMDAAAMKAA